MKLIKGINIPINSHIIYQYLFEKNQFDDSKTFISIKSFIDFLNNKGFNYSFSKMKELNSYEFCEYIIATSKLQNPINPFIFGLIDVILEQSKKNGGSINSFLDFWEEKHMNLKIELAEKKDSVKLFSIHKSKGLEFPVVIFPVQGFDSRPQNRDFLWAEPGENIMHLIPKVLIGDEYKGLKSNYKNIIEEEKDRKELDEMNMIYVACTRPTEQLIMCFNKEYGKADLWQEMILSLNIPEDRIEFKEDNRITIGKTNSKKTKITEDKSSLHLHHFISSDWSERIQLKRETLNNKTRQSKANKGIQLHELLSNYNTEKNIDEFISEAVSLKIIDGDHREEFKCIIKNLNSNPKTLFFFDSQHIRINEREILTPDNKIYRPDMVIRKNDDIHIIDFKYANHEEISDYEKLKHIKQVTVYTELITQIENCNTRGYILYLQDKIELIEI